MTDDMTAQLPGSKFPKNHRLVYEIITAKGIGTHLTMADVFDLARLQQPGIGFTTVYRAVTRLRDTGMISEIVMPGADSAVYEPAGPPHAHFRCAKCGRIEDIDFALPAELTQTLAAKTGARIDSALVTLHGQCQTCS